MTGSRTLPSISKATVFDPATLAEPIVQAPLAGGPSTPELAIAVCEAGGLGFLAAGYKTAEAVRGQIDALRAHTDRPFGVNIFMPSPEPADPAGLQAYLRRIEAEAARHGADVGEPRFEDDHFDADWAARRYAEAFRDYGLDLNRLVAEVLALYEQSGTRIQAKLQKNVPLVRGDPDRLRQVIHNLLQNAQDALFGSSDPRIEVSTELSGGQVWLRISDNGCGFPEAIINGAFEPYVTTKRKGTGLGLAIVKRIIDEHHGTVRIENHIGKEGGRGAAVRISLPLAA